MDYQKRPYLSVVEVASYLGMPVQRVHRLAKSGALRAEKSTSGQYRFKLVDVDAAEIKSSDIKSADVKNKRTTLASRTQRFEVRGTVQTVFCDNAQNMQGVDDNSVHLVITSPPYFNAKMYSKDLPSDLGNVHDLDKWFDEIAKVWGEVHRVLQPGRKFFLNIMNLPVKEGISFRTLNLVGKTIDVCEAIGFIFKRDIIWHKTNGVRAHFGTYPYPGGILINNMHEHILEFGKAERKGFKKYQHVTRAQKESSRLDKSFWLSIKNSDVWLMKPSSSGASRTHAAPFPVELPQRLIKAYSFVGETVLDPFLGSGTTLVAAAEEGRDGIGFEINAEFINLASQRIQILE